MKTPTLTPAEVARSYIERFGTPAVPCQGKRSLSKWSQSEGRAATTEEVDQLFNQHRHADGVGLLLGCDTGLLVVDTDSEAAHLDHETWRQESSVQETRTHTSPGGDERRHYWYRAPEGVTPPGKNRKDYGDIKATGGYVVAPGLENGRLVELDIEPVQLTVEQYEALYALFGSSGQRDEQGTSVNDVAPSPEAADEALLAIPNNDDRFAPRDAWIGMAHRHKTAGGTVGAFVEWSWGDDAENERVWETLPENQHAGGYSTLLRMAEHLGERETTPEEQAHVDATASARAADEFEADPDALSPETKKSSTQETERRRDFWLLSELADNPDLLTRGERLTPTGMGHRGELTLIAGLPKQGKSRFCAWEASVCSREGTKVLWVSFEEALPRLVSRFTECGADFGNVGVALYPASLERITELIDAMDAGVIYIDSGASYVGNTLGKIPDNSQSTEWQNIYAALQRVAIEKDVAIIVLVHSPNAQPGEVRGSNGASAAADAIWKMKGSIATRKRTFAVVGRWDNEKLAYESNHDTSPTDFVQVDALVAVSLAARIFQHLVRNPNSTTDAIRKEIRGGNYQTLKRELETLAEARYIEEHRGTGKSHNARLWTAGPGFTISDDGQRIVSQSDISELDTEVAA